MQTVRNKIMGKEFKGIIESNVNYSGEDWVLGRLRMNKDANCLEVWCGKTFHKIEPINERCERLKNKKKLLLLI